MARLTLWLATLAFCVLPGWGQAQRQALFLDRSGSMKPYYENGLIQAIVQPLDSATTGSGSLAVYAFSTDVSPQRTLAQIETMPFGSFTFLDKVIDACERQRLPLAWIVTDNIEDTGAAGNTERFYARLRSDSVRRITVFPVLAPRGKPGLVVYALLFDPAADALYNGMLQGFAARGAGVLHTDPLRMKPVDRDTVEVTTQSLAPLTRRGGPKVYDTGVPLRESVEVRFRSKFDHIRIVDSTLRVPPSAPRFQPDSLLVPERGAIAITPDRIRSLGPGDETAQVYRLTVDLGSVHLKNSPAAWWQAAWSKPNEEAELDARFVIDVPQENFRLSPKFLTDYSAATIDVARETGKVYALDHLLSSVNSQHVLIQVDSPLFFKISYPSWPAILFLALFALAAGLLILLVVFGRRLLPVRHRAWTVAATGRGGNELDARIEAAQVIVAGEAIGRIERNRLFALPPARFDKQPDGFALQPGAQVHVRTRRNELDLTFNEAHDAAGNRQPAAAVSTSTAASPRGPIKRR